MKIILFIINIIQFPFIKSYITLPFKKKQKNLSNEKYLILFKHEAVYYLYKNKKLPEGMTKKIFV